MNNVRSKGFTLIELMAVLAIVAILVALALPSYRDTVRKSRRADAMNALVDLHLSQERWRVNNASYGTLAALGFDADADGKMPSPDGHYSLTITNVAATTYTIVADSLGDQANDFCGDFSLAFNAGVITKTADGDNDRCWTK